MTGHEPPPLALVGPTASGKTRLAVSLASLLRAEVVAIDSMTIYRGMDIGTAKPTAEERARVPHHLLDIADPFEPFTVARFQSAAREAIAGIRARGRVPMLVGGSGLYLRATLDDLEFPPHDPAVRARLETLPPVERQRRLREQDPDALAFVDIANERRVVRALEVIEISGRPFSSFRAAWDEHAPAIVAGLEVSPAALAERIEARTRRMLADGLLDEVRALVARGYGDALTAARATGYSEAVALLDGATTEAEFIEAVVRSTRRLARRQMAWFRRDPRVRWFPADEIEHAEQAVRAYYEERLAPWNAAARAGE